jgi:hypothetical protein
VNVETELAQVIGNDTPLRLAAAAKLAFPDGGMTATGLRREAKRDRLVVYRIAGKDFTTLGNIKRMRELCRVKQARRDSTCDRNGGTSPASSLTLPPGLSLIAVAKSELAAALRTEAARSKP